MSSGAKIAVVTLLIVVGVILLVAYNNSVCFHANVVDFARGAVFEKSNLVYYYCQGN